MATDTLKRFTTGFLPMVILSLLLLISLLLMSAATQNSAQFGRIFFFLLAVNVLGLVTLIVLIGVNLVRLIKQYRRKATGSRLTVRLVIIFVLLSLLPVSVVYYFSLGFIQRGIDSWFDVGIEQALNDTLQLTRLALDDRKSELLQRSQHVAQQLAQQSAAEQAINIHQLRLNYAAQELTLLAADRRVLAFSHADAAIVTPNLPDWAMLSHLQQLGNYLGMDYQQDGQLMLRIMVPVTSRTGLGQDLILQASYPVSHRINHLTESVESAFAEYRQLTLLRDPLKFSFSLTLSLVLLLSVLSAVWAAFFSARRLVAPIRALAIGTRAVAAGDYTKQLPQHSGDELGFLVRSFNDMTRRIAHSREEVELSQQQAERERAYLRAVLGHLSSGVVTLDRDHMIRTANFSSGQILGVDLKDFVGQSLEQMSEQHHWLQNFIEVVSRHLDANTAEWREQLTVAGPQGQQVLICGGAALPGVGGRRAGHVIIFDDVTALVQAQRDAAWGEVARRLAHEIKNPLTPIRLSAERLRHKYLATLPNAEGELLDRLTHTIIQQVEVMQKMVKAFAEYAYAPQLQLMPVVLNDVINEVLDLYRDNIGQVRLLTKLGSDVPAIEVDSGRLRQLLHNLIKNALEALHDQRDSQVVLATRVDDQGGTPVIVLSVQDNGPGIPEQMLAQVSEPYVSSKPKGSGLGLAIVKKIAEEHGALLRVYNNAIGCCVEVQFPLMTHEPG